MSNIMHCLLSSHFCVLRKMSSSRGSASKAASSAENYEAIISHPAAPTQHSPLPNNVET